MNDELLIVRWKMEMSHDGLVQLSRCQLKGGL